MNMQEKMANALEEALPKVQAKNCTPARCENRSPAATKAHEESLEKEAQDGAGRRLTNETAKL